MNGGGAPLIRPVFVFLFRRKSVLVRGGAAVLM